MKNKTAEYNKERLDELKKRLKITLSDLFQIDSPDLDFGVYRIMNQKRGEITKFMNVELIDAVDEEFGKYDAEVRENITKEKAEIEQKIKEEIDEDALCATGVKPDFLNSKLARELNEKWNDLEEREKDASMSDVQKAEIFAHLEDFFSRYYKDGDFLSLRRYAANEKYAVPYNGEEVLLHWANKDQYYIKTDRFLKGHGFDVGSYRVMFEVAKSESGEGNGSGKEKKRYFILSGKEDEVEYDDKRKLLTIRFGHVPLSDDELKGKFPPGKTRQKPNTDDIVDGLVSAILAKDCVPGGLKKSLGENEKETDANPRLRKHVLGFTKESSSDFFIHKDLGGFLRQELDFFIKNEVFRLDDLGTENEVPVERYVKRAKVLKTIALRIIDFLAQLEDFQKMLWEKKKFVLQTDYCMTVDHIPETYYEEICANVRQLEEWKKLYAICEDEQQTLGSSGKGVIDAEFLKTHPYLVLDTAFFDASFKDRVLEDLKNPGDGTPVTDLDEATGGLMIKSENWQALNLLQERYREQVKCVYIDPPYNTESSKIIYQNNYKHSTWLTLMSDRMILAKKYLSDDFTHITAIDEIEQELLGQCISQIFNESKKVCVSVVHNPRGQQGKNVSYTNEFNYIVYPNDSKKYISDIKRDEVDARNLRDSGTESDRTDAKNCFYPFIVKNNKIVEIGQIPSDSFHPSSANVMNGDGTFEIWPIDESGNEKKWRYSLQTVSQILEKLEIKKGRNSLQVIFNKDFGVMKTVWADPKYDASEYGSKLLQSLFGQDITSKFSYPKSIYTVIESLVGGLNSNVNGLVLDYFSGSGTTAHAVLNLNKEDEGTRKYILVEMGDYFHTVTKPRIQKVAYSSNWKNGKPQDTDGQSHIFKYMILESYEDTLDNIEFLDSSGHLQTTIFSVRDYMLRYFLDFETKESPCRLNIENMATPFAYTLKVRRDSEFLDVPADKDGFRDVTIDLVETFNYLLGLHVIRRVSREHNGLNYRIVHGTTPDNRKTTIVWRNSPKNPEEHREALEADAAFISEKIMAEFPDKATLYVNGHCFVPDAEPIEPAFKKLMGA